MNENYEQYSQVWEEPEARIADTGEVASPAVAQVDALPAMQSSSTFASPKAIKKLSARTELSAETARCRAVIARQSLMNLCVLSHTEEVLSELTPTSAAAARYKLIVDSVAASDARMILMFGGDWK